MCIAWTWLGFAGKWILVWYLAKLHQNQDNPKKRKEKKNPITQTWVHNSWLSDSVGLLHLPATKIKITNSVRSNCAYSQVQTLNWSLELTILCLECDRGNINARRALFNWNQRALQHEFLLYLNSAVPQYQVPSLRLRQPLLSGPHSQLHTITQTQGPYLHYHCQIETTRRPKDMHLGSFESILSHPFAGSHSHATVWGGSRGIFHGGSGLLHQKDALPFPSALSS